MIDLTDKVAIVTGGASGIGKGICLVLARQGANLAVADMNSEGAEAVAATASDMGRQAKAIAVDVTDKASVDHMVAGALDTFGQVDILVNDAGVIGAPNWWKREAPNDDDWDRALAVNLRGMVSVSQAVEPHMKARRYGKIINIASTAGRQGGPGIPQYHASKAAVISWTQSHAQALGPYDVNVNTICPGPTWTPMFERLIQRGAAPESEASTRGLTGRGRFKEMLETWSPLKRERTPEDIGKLAAFLASDDSQFITGQAINADGGRRMN